MIFLGTRTENNCQLREKVLSELKSKRPIVREPVTRIILIHKKTIHIMEQRIFNFHYLFF